MPTTRVKEIYELAESQHGYFAMAQATAAGIRSNAVVLMARRGVLERISQGVYRIVNYPVFEHGQLLEASLWPLGGVRGVISHDSALRFHELSDVSPAKVHITIPTTHRVRRAVPRYLVVHRADLSQSDVEVIEGIPVTTPRRSIIDAHGTHLGPALIRQAIEDGRQSGRLTNKEADSLTAQLITHESSAGIPGSASEVAHGSG